MPSSVPPLVTPNEKKIDLTHLKADIPKYAAVAGFGSTTTEWWHSFVTSLEESMRQQQCGMISTPWLYPELLNLAKNGVRTARAMVTLPTQLINMRAVETDSLPEVCLQYCRHECNVLLRQLELCRAQHIIPKVVIVLVVLPS